MARDIQGERLRALNGWIEAFLQARRLRAGEGRDAGEAEAHRLFRLGGRLASDILGWGAQMSELETARAGAFDAERAAALILETVFDETLHPDAWRVLTAAVSLAQCSR